MLINDYNERYSSIGLDTLTIDECPVTKSIIHLLQLNPNLFLYYLQCSHFQ